MSCADGLEVEGLHSSYVSPVCEPSGAVTVPSAGGGALWSAKSTGSSGRGKARSTLAVLLAE